MELYWLDKSADKTKCPYDHQPLQVIIYRRSDINAYGYQCTMCENIYLPFISTEVAAAHTDVKPNYLSGSDRVKVQELIKQAKIKKAKEEQEKRRKEEERLRREKNEAEKKRIAALVAKRAKKENFIAQIKAALRDDYFAAESFFKANNDEQILSFNEFKSLRDNYVENWFSENTPPDKHLPDEEQLAAICSTEKNVEVVARAGSGKTTTIVNRFRFLTENCHVDPSTIVLLAFNRDARKKLKEDIESLFPTQEEKAAGMPHIMTFHALAYSIVHPMEELIYDDDKAGTEKLSYTVQSIIDEKLRDITWSSKIREVMTAHFKGTWEAIEAGGHNLSKEDQLLYRRSLPNRTLKGEYVKSYGEKVIANILFEHDIDYWYEKAWRWPDGSPYRPDFTIKNENGKTVIIEYFGLAGDQEYDAQIQKKQDFWIKRNIPLIEVYPEDIRSSNTTLTTELLAFLEEEGVASRALTEEEIWEKIKDRAIDEFTKTAKTFIGRCRKKEISLEGLDLLIQGYSSDLPAELIFLDIVREIYSDYLHKLKQDELEDFDGLMSRASADIREGKTLFDKREQRSDLKSITHIMIDEYQDFSFLFDVFLAEIRKVCPQAYIFCVGDDWQAINAFAGSDVQYFQNFTERYNNSKKYYLKTNYRSQQEIVTASSRLMSSGLFLNSIKAAKDGQGTIRIGYLTNFVASPIEREVHGDYEVLLPALLRLVQSILAQDKQVVLLTRANERLPLGFKPHEDAKGTPPQKLLATIQSFFAPEQRERITTSTVHKYKGQEQDAVILLDANISYYPLIHPAWVFQRIFGDSLEKLVEDEKRLFYVAVSRAKDDLYILTMRGDESPFIQNLGFLLPFHWNDYEPLGTSNGSILITVGNQPGYGSLPTRSIKEILKLDDYNWDPIAKVWYHYYPLEDFDITSIISQDWAKTADHVILTQYDENNQISDQYLYEGGTPAQIPFS